MAASALGLECELVVWGDPNSANLALAVAAGARLRPTGGSDREAVDELGAARAAELTSSGRRAQSLPRGGSTPLGAVGFAVAAAELVQQLDVIPARVVLAVGSGGSCAGLLAGFAALGVDVPVLGVSVSRPLDEIEPRVLALAADCARLLGTPAPRPDRLALVDARGPGFGTASASERSLAGVALRSEGLLFDHTYGAEALAVAVDVALARPDGPVLLWHTGGIVPAVASTIRKKGSP
jgi:1-aminocyclopropane-1-carboxylate deaminase/D-cysteine desulfhydrase-like pyridoxal-dependent ACC family enzyme